MAVSILQSAKNISSYQVQPLVVTLPSPSTTGSFIAVVVEAQKSGYPFSTGSISANTPQPIVTDNEGNTYTLVDKIVGLSQDSLSSPPVTVPDASGYYPSLYVYVSGTTTTGAAATAGTRSIALAAFYPDEVTSPLQPGGNLGSPPLVNGRPVFDGGLVAQVFELAGVGTGVDQHGHATTSGSTPLGASIFTTSAVAGLILEVGVLLDSSSVGSYTTSPPTSPFQQYSGSIASSSSYFSVQTTTTTGATLNPGFSNFLKYTGGVVAVAFK
jgi:hypothetical protein